MMVQHVLDMQVLAFKEEQENALILNICFDVMNVRKCIEWAFHMQFGLIDRMLLVSFTKKMFNKEHKSLILHCNFFVKI
jgi:hypothetical protein